MPEDVNARVGLLDYNLYHTEIIFIAGSIFDLKVVQYSGNNYPKTGDSYRQWYLFLIG